jgi:hypothetical protein
MWRTVNTSAKIAELEAQIEKLEQKLIEAHDEASYWRGAYDHAQADARYYEARWRDQ